MKWALLIVLLVILGRQSVQLTERNLLPLNDFIEYWAAARLQLVSANPYSPEQLFALQKPLGWSDEVPLMMWNPPWTLPLVMPFSLLDYATGRGLWFLLNLALLLLSLDLLWQFYGGPKRSRWLAWVVGFLFLPTFNVASGGWPAQSPCSWL